MGRPMACLTLPNTFHLPALRSLGDLADNSPVIVCDTREQEPLVFTRFTSVRGTLQTGDYSIADIAIFPWMRYGDRRGVNVDEFSNVKRWFESIDARPAVKRGLDVLNEKSRNAPMSDKEKEILFGATQYAKR